MIKLSYYKRATHVSAPTLILLHAFPFSSGMWDDLIQKLSDLDISIATIDLPGFGQEPNREWTMLDVARSLNETIQANGITRPILCGLSMGGYLALAYSKFYPSTLAGLILADTRAAADSEGVKKDREVFAQDALKRGAIAAIERNLDKMTSGHTKANAPATVEKIKSWILEADGQAIANALRAMAGRSDTMEILPSLTIPVLLIVGEDDPVTPPAEMEKMAGHMSDATFVKIANASHMSVSEKPEEFAEAIREYFRLSS